MILDEIVLHDFGVYGGHQKVNLTPVSRERPIILFGGLNGGGKTTLLDALQLCFFGNMAKCAGRGSLNYDEYLRRCVHHGAIAAEAAVEVSFRHTVDGETQSWRLVRSWAAGENVRERFQVHKNGNFDKAASDHWSSQVEDFIPARIADLFLFDGEKVEGYADLEQAPGLIRSAVQNLLGLDVVERLGSDLLSIERRKKAELKTPQEAEVLSLLREAIRKSVVERGQLVTERASAANDVDRLQRQFDELDGRYEREGGSLYDDRGRIEAELSVAQRSLDAVRRSLRDLAGGAAPLNLVMGLLSDVAVRTALEERARRFEQTAEVVEEEHLALFRHPALNGLSGEAKANLKSHAKERVARLRADAATPRFLNLDNAASASLNELQGGGLKETGSGIAELLKQEAAIKASIANCEALLASVPSHAVIADLLSERDATNDSLKLAQYEQQRRDAEIARLDREISTARERETHLLETSAREQFEQEDIGRVLLHSSKVRDTLDRFRNAVVKRHVARIEGFVLDSFRQLIRKSTLVCGLSINPQTFEVELTGAKERKLSSERLSAGERQLLAVALLWGLARASGRPLPTVIDTPLGRLDSEHRSRLVSRYFPKASHQVMLLSTDEEITRSYYETLKPAIGRSYRLRYDEDAARTVIEDGYFGDKEPSASWQ